jgi:hypothetical protein
VCGHSVVCSMHSCFQVYHHIMVRHAVRAWCGVYHSLLRTVQESRTGGRLSQAHLCLMNMCCVLCTRGHVCVFSCVVYRLCVCVCVCVAAACKTAGLLNWLYWSARASHS